MRRLTKFLFGVASATTFFASTVLADEWSLSGYADVTSDYRFRGISQNDRKASPQVSLNLYGPNGFYAGTWESTTDWDGAGHPAFEADFYAGKHIDLNGADLNISALYYAYPDAHFGATASYFEAMVGLSRALGPLTGTITGAWSPDWSLGGGNGYYLEGTGSLAVNDWLTISADAGHQWVDATPYDYSHWDIGATASYDNWAFDLRYVDTDLTAAHCAAFWMDTKNACAATLTASLTYNIPDIVR